MIKEIDLVISPDDIFDNEKIKSQILQQEKLQPQILKEFKIRKRSIDARGRNVIYRLKVLLYIEENPVLEVFKIDYPSVQNAKPVIIVGAGPAGLFAALRLIEFGLKPIIIERGKDVKQRRRDLAIINKEGIINSESNYCFGEGGAGTYSDGKLYTRSDKRGDVTKMLQILVAHGATEDILVDARPHIGTNKLPQIITAIRETIIDAGGEVHFNTKLTDIKIKDQQVKAAVTNQGVFETSSIILATGHSARDIYELLREKGILLEAKPFALGVRIEHPQSIIDQSQYSCEVRHDNLPPAYYSLVTQVQDRGVFSFCMCPGGIIAPCATNEKEIIVNGWSPSKRNNPYANSGTVVQVNIDDVAKNLNNSFSLLDFQSEIERKAYEAGGGFLKAPAQRMVDFVNNKISNDLPANSYLPGLTSANLHEVLPPFIAKRLQQALPQFGNKMPNRGKSPGYYTNEAVLVGVESRTSSPIRIPRGKETLQHPQIKGLFPCAEGAGYAGGIISAAIDGQACADAVFKS
ncbi:MAG: FAD-dependent monooxygenase [Bacteroidetes bacterium]|nr:FAD-dependent monooxygenase [Bacteroidota bacterium]MBU1373528.1 FAD-dependent monooxygenase [Bacteroidota bacterium]MBU1484359.1 FAD-dependent monooxygenase [Bacteroidota bacterium]MBU1759696.1 FAD-dependent monooxygenase [Bacteroidota bacterium]MBU2266873.1 FAD-dependent monooxygenase [Bacteroidota bacterium]